MDTVWDGRGLKVKVDELPEDEDAQAMENIIDGLEEEIEMLMEEAINKLNDKYPDLKFSYSID